MRRFALRGATIFVLGLLSFLLGARPVFADRLLRSVRGWNLVQSDEYKGCVAIGRYRDQTKVRIGFDGVSSLIFVNLSNPNWDSLPLNIIYELTFNFDDGAKFSGFFRSRLRKSVFTFENGEVSEQFMRALADARRVEIFVEGRQITALKLSGTRAAINAVKSCRQ